MGQERKRLVRNKWLLTENSAISIDHDAEWGNYRLRDRWGIHYLFGLRGQYEEVEDQDVYKNKWNDSPNSIA